MKIVTATLLFIISILPFTTTLACDEQVSCDKAGAASAIKGVGVNLPQFNGYF